MSLRAARDRRDEARKLLAGGVDPSEHRKAMQASKAERAVNSVEAVAREWFGKRQPTWAAKHADRILAWLEHDVFPWVGGRPVASPQGAA